MLKPLSSKHPVFGHSYMIRAVKCRALERMHKKPIHEIIDGLLEESTRREIQEWEDQQKAKRKARAAEAKARLPPKSAVSKPARVPMVHVYPI